VSRDAVRIGPPVRTAGAVTAEIRLPGRDAVRVRFSGPDDALADGADSLLAGALLPAMRLDAPLRTAAPVSGALLDNTTRIQAVVAAWDAGLHPIEVRAPRRAPAPSRSTGEAAFFSGGIDSFHTALRHADRLSGLIFLHGFDIPLQERARREGAAGTVRLAAAELGLPLVEVATDLRPVARPYVTWQRYHGAVLASVALLLTPRFGVVHVPGSLSYDTWFPHGSHPLLDPFWSTEQVELRYDGFDANRWEKTRAVAGSEVALRRLRVCSRDERGDRNCGRCEKCLRTMVSLRLLGALDRSDRFPGTLDLELVGRVASLGGGTRAFWEQNLAAAEQSGDAALAWTLRAALRRQRPATVPTVGSSRPPVARVRQLPRR
jgi:hypothetical protein